MTKPKICGHSCPTAGMPKEYLVSKESLQVRPKIPRTQVKLGDLIPELAEVLRVDPSSVHVAEFLRAHPVELDSLSPYVHFSSGKYTRNLIEITDQYELMILCWDRGQMTPVHNHAGQSCWVYLLTGQLSFTNFKWVGCDRVKRTMHIEEVSRVPMAAQGSMNVIDEKDAIHRLGNDEAFGEQALSLHLYAKPLKTCAVYNVENGSCMDRELTYFSVGGKIL